MFRNIQQVKRSIAAKEVSDNAFLSCNISCTQTSGNLTPSHFLGGRSVFLIANDNYNSNEDGQNTSEETGNIQPQDEELQTDLVPVLQRLPPDVAAPPPLLSPQSSPAFLRHLPGLSELWSPRHSLHLPWTGEVSACTVQTSSASLFVRTMRFSRL